MYNIKIEELDISRNREKSLVRTIAEDQKTQRVVMSAAEEEEEEEKETLFNYKVNVTIVFPLHVMKAYRGVEV
jgi:hypothetical protein